MAKDLVAVEKSALTPAQYGQLTEVPPELEWLANITNAKTRRAYRNDVSEVSVFAGLRGPAELRTVTRAHVIAWRKDLEARMLAPSSIRRKLSALSALFDYLCERNAVAGNPVDGVKRPMANGNEGSTPALGDAQARKLLDAPPDDTLKGVRDRAILATLVYCRCALQRRPTRFRMRPISPRSKNGLATRMFRQRGSMIGERHGRRTVQRLE
jgi:integrase/recombinase XerD